MRKCSGTENGSENDDYTNETPLQIGDRLDGYKIKSILQKNSNCELYQVVKKDTMHVLKQTKITNDKSFFERIKNEINELNKKHLIVEYHEFLIDKNYFRAVMDLYNEDFGKFLRDKKLEKDKILDYLFQINNALAHLHKLKIVHGDLKPSNILMKKMDLPARLKVTAFGFNSRTSKSATGYHAPEQRCKDDKTLVDISTLDKPEAVDMWALGVIFYEMKNNNIDIFLTNRELTLTEIENFDDDELKMLERMLDANPESRIAPISPVGTTKNNLKDEITKLQDKNSFSKSKWINI